MLAISLNVSLSKSEIKDENLVACFVQSNTEVIGFNIPVNEVSVMNVLNSLNHLINKHQDSFERELS